jgi:Mycothiol maleylpyruvate isomerase N-terminal domain
MEALNRSFESTRAILAKAQPGDLDATTPCASWDVSALVNHFVGTARWWAAIVTGAGAAGEVGYAAGDFVSGISRAPSGSTPIWTLSLPRNCLPGPGSRLATPTGDLTGWRYSDRLCRHPPERAWLTSWPRSSGVRSKIRGGFGG